MEIGMARKKCTKNNPSDGTPYKWYHPNAKLVDSCDDWNSDSYDIYKCSHCGITFEVTVGK